MAVQTGELAPDMAAQICGYRNGQLTGEEHRLLAILDDAIAAGCITHLSAA